MFQEDCLKNVYTEISLRVRQKLPHPPGFVQPVIEPKVTYMLSLTDS